MARLGCEAVALKRRAIEGSSYWKCQRERRNQRKIHWLTGAVSAIFFSFALAEKKVDFDVAMGLNKHCNKFYDNTACGRFCAK